MSETTEQIKTIRHALAYGEGLPKAEAALDGIVEKAEALAAFKTFVHKRLDEAGVPHDPDAQHNAETGCRIGGRLNWLIECAHEVGRLREALTAMLEECGCGCCAGNGWYEAKELARAALAYGEGLPKAEAALDGIVEKAEALAAFKTFVHKRLDEAGVPHDPDAQHNAETGCRIGGRLAWLIGESLRLREMLAHAYTGPLLYTDDGELQDNRREPFIDFKRDTLDEIGQKMRQRGEAAGERR